MTVQSLLNDLFAEFSDSTKQPQRDSHEVRPDDVHQSGDPERIQDYHERKLPDRKPGQQIDGGMEGRNQDAQAATDSACSARKAGAVDGDLSRIREWCVRIGETDEEVIAEVLEKCRSDPEARRYYLCRATETEPRIHAAPETVVQRWMPGGECYERIRSGWRLSRTPDGGYVWLEPGSWTADGGRAAA
jgi:hypothetical protein